MFLSAPYGESPFSLLSFLGLLAFTESFPILSSSGIVEDFLLLASGAILACATTIRSNGILSGTLFLVEAVRIVLSLREGITVNKLRRLVFTGLGGLVLGTGFLYPQYVAYIQYCTGTAALDDRPWCSRTLPGIYTFVQNHYW
jgi:phosphatidylinositol glycan class V